MIALWAFKVEVGFASTLLGAMVFLMSLTYFTNHSDQDGCTGPTISRLFFWVSSPWVVPIHNSSTFIYSSEMQPMVYISQPMVYMFIYQPIEICNVFICSYQSPPPQDQEPTEFNTPNPAGYPQIYLWSHQSDHRHFLRRIQPAMSIQTGVDHTGLVFLSTDLRS